MMPTTQQAVNGKSPGGQQERNPFLAESYWDKPEPRPWKLHCRPRPHIMYYVPCPAYDKISTWLCKEAKKRRSRDRGRMLRQHGGHKELMRRLKAVFGLRCQYCSATGTNEHPNNGTKHSRSLWSIDRIVPTGDYSPTNITLACSICNNSKQTKPLLRPVRCLAEAEAASWQT